MANFNNQQEHVRTTKLMSGFRIEHLEPRRLFNLDLSITAGVLLIQETNVGVDNTTVISLINGGTALKVVNGTDDLTNTPAMIQAGWTLFQNLSYDTGPVSSFSSILVDTYDGNDILEIDSNSMPIIIDPRGASNAEVLIGSQNSDQGVQGITAPVTFTGTNAGSLDLYLDDRGDTTDLDPTVKSNTILNFAPAPVNFSWPPGSASGKAITLSCDAGKGRTNFVLQQDPFNGAPIDYSFGSYGTGTLSIETLNANSVVSASADSGGTELVRLGAKGLVSTVKGAVDVEGNTGSASMIVNDSEDTVAHTFSTKSSGAVLEVDEDGTKFATLDKPFSSLTLQTGTASNTVNLALDEVSAPFLATVDSNGTNDAVNVTGLAAGADVDIAGSTGVDNVALNAFSIHGTVNISNAIGQEAVAMDDASTSSPQAITASDASVTGLGDGKYVFSNLKSLAIIGGKAFDNFTVSPSTTVPLTIDGGPNTGTSTDRLEIKTTNVAGIQLSLQDSTTGSYNFTNRQPVNFARIATFDPAEGDVAGTVYNAQTGIGLAGATIVVDQNNNGIADVGETTTTSDANGAFSFQALPVGTFNLLAQALGFQNESTVPVTIATGVLSPSVALPVIPIAAATGADLTATVTTTNGKISSIKPKAVVKIKNVGTISGAATLRIELFASQDQSLDPNDVALGATTTAPLILAPKQTRAFTLTGATTATLVKGNYYILVSIDAGNALAESNEANNVAVSVKTVLLAPPFVDLTGKFGALPKKANKSKLLTVAVTIQNLGNIPATGTINVDFFASTDKTLDNADIALGTGFPLIAHVAAGKTQLAKFKLAVNSLTTGNYYIVAKINTTGSIAETDPTNNDLFSSTLVAIS